jgi:hypothetical protein
MSEEKKRKASAGKKDSVFKTENKKEVLRFTIDENITKKQHPPPGDNYCNIF